MKTRLLITVGNLGRGGAEKQLIMLLRHFDSNDLEIAVVNFNRSREEFWSPTLRELPIQYVHLSEARSHLSRMRGLFREVRRFNPDVVWAWHFFTGAYVYACRGLGSKFAHIQGVRNDTKYLLSIHKWAPWLMRRTHLVVSNSEDARRDIVALGVKDSHAMVLPNSIDMDGNPPALRNTATKIGFCGNFHARKGIDLFLEAAAKIRNQSTDLQFVIAGSGDDSPYQKRTDELGLRGVVEFRQDVTCQDEIATYDIFVLPSRHEGIPNVLMEAMALARPCIAANVGGVGELVTHEEHALVIPPEDVEALEGAVRDFLCSAPLRHRLATNAFVRAQSFKASTNIGQWLPKILRTALRHADRG